ncbi:MAG TPA: glycosyltransferase family 39 protein [Solirubrobacteraceae bacterium]|jgi:4-amino-4-deoxy-L-arabinose transferase-like glycosyltransferase|nr:glycosyltransferase family 39 protein [Solirubrobacteraceae bacterium]
MSNSWESTSAVPSAGASGASSLGTGAAGAGAGAGVSFRAGLRALAARLPRPELGALIVLAGLLDLWALARNGFANDYYSAAVRSMSSSWHNFLFASADPSGVMSVDKPPLDLWVQSLSVRVFGYHPLSMLVPQALMGVASVALVYDLVRRRFGRLGGFVAGLALALTPITVAISRHNNPDVLLILCCVAALWFTVRALEDGRTRWLVLAGVAVGLGFETKMLVALTVVPGIALAYLYVAPRGRLRALRQLFAGGGAMLLVGGAWPALVALTPAADRPWVSGTSDNSILSLIFEYNGLGRVDGQAGGPGGIGGGNVFGGSTGPLRLLNSALGGQAGWLLGFALVSGLGVLLASRLRRADARSGWLIAVGGAFLTTAVLFSSASGIFHPYYVSLIAPFAAALVGAGATQLLGSGRQARVLVPLALAAGVASELAVLHDYPGQLSWLPPVLIALCLLAALALVLVRVRRVRLLAAAVALAALLFAPAVWAVDTLGHATNGTFPEGGPANVQSAGGIFGGPGGRGAGRGGFGGFAAGGPGAGGVGARAGGGAPEVSASGPPAGGVPLLGAGGSTAAAGGSAAGTRAGAQGGFGGGAGAGGGIGAGGAIGAPLGNDRTITQALAYAKQHGGGTVAVSSQSSAASAIISSDAKVAGIGGFSGRESDVTTSWLAHEVGSGAIRWVLVEQSGVGGGRGAQGLAGDTRAGSKAAMSAAAKACRRVTLSTDTGETASAGAAGTTSLFSSESSPAGAAGANATVTAGSTALYDCQGRAAAIATA